jgi:Flp pilus assembly protein CpaB
VPPVITPQIPASAPSRAAFNAPVAKKKTSPMLVLTVVAIVGCMLIGIARMATSAKPADTVQVVAAATDLPAGCRIGFANLHYMVIPKKYYVPTMINSYEELIGKYTRTFTAAREPFVSTAVMSNTHGLTGELPKGYRAITLKLTDDATVDSQARPGDRVDVVATTTYKSKKYTKTIAENLLVMLSMPKEAAMSEKFSSTENNKVTVAVAPDAAEVLSEAMENSKLRLTLRSLGDLSKAVLNGADERDLLPHEALREEPPVAKVVETSVSAPPAPPALPSYLPQALPSLPEAVQQPAKWLVQMFSGSQRQMVDIEQSK